jgi:hypothetical protein
MAKVNIAFQQNLILVINLLALIKMVKEQEKVLTTIIMVTVIKVILKMEI